MKNSVVLVGIGVIVGIILAYFLIIGTRGNNAGVRAGEPPNTTEQTLVAGGSAPDAGAGKSQAGGEAVRQGGDGKGNYYTKEAVLDSDDPATITKTLDKLLDEDNDNEAILREAGRLAKHPNPEVRDRVAFAYNWIGVAALPALTKMLGDPDPEVEDSVRTYWKDTVAGVENEIDKGDMLMGAAEVFGDNIDTDFLDDLVMDMSMLDEIVALPRLMELLKTLTDKERAAMIVEAIEDITAPEETGKNKDEVLRKAQEYQAELEAEAAEKNEPATTTVPVMRIPRPLPRSPKPAQTPGN